MIRKDSITPCNVDTPASATALVGDRFFDLQGPRRMPTAHGDNAGTDAAAFNPHRRN